MNPAFSNKLVIALVPRFQALANELIDGFAARGRCEFMTEFAEPYATRVAAWLLGVPEGEWRTLAGWSEKLGLGLAVTARDHVAEMEEGLAGSSGRRRGDRRPPARPQGDFVAHLVRPARTTAGSPTRSCATTSCC